MFVKENLGAESSYKSLTGNLSLRLQVFISTGNLSLACIASHPLSTDGNREVHVGWGYRHLFRTPPEGHFLRNRMIMLKRTVSIMLITMHVTIGK